MERVRGLEQYIYLSTIDGQWKDHLLAMDHLRQGIGLRGYGQLDPKKEYAKEGYEMFVAMMWRIRSNFISTLMRVQPAPTEDAESLERKFQPKRLPKMVASHGDSGEADGDGEPGAKAAHGAGHAQGRPQRPLPLRERQEVQEVPPAVGRGAGVASPVARSLGPGAVPG